MAVALENQGTCLRGLGGQQIDSVLLSQFAIHTCNGRHLLIVNGFRLGRDAPPQAAQNINKGLAKDPGLVVQGMRTGRADHR